MFAFGGFFYWDELAYSPRELLGRTSCLWAALTFHLYYVYLHGYVVASRYVSENVGELF